MARALAILVVLGGLYAVLNVHTHGVDGAFSGAIARLWKGDDSKARWVGDPEPGQLGASWEGEGRTRPQPVGQRVRERVNRAMDEGARRHGGAD